MDAKRLKTSFFLPALVCSFIVFTAANVRADLSSKQARKAITRMAGFELKDSSVRVKSISVTNPPANAGGSDSSASAGGAHNRAKCPNPDCASYP